MTIRAWIVDDERHARAKLRAMLVAQEDVQVLGESRNGSEAEEMIRAHRPDLVFLDIQMPGQSGLEVMERAADALRYVIFTTAYDEYAVKAFELAALDYILKPFDKPRLELALERVRQRMRSGEDLQERLRLFLDQVRPRQGLLRDRLLLKTAGRVTFVRAADVDWIEAADNYVRVHTGRESHLVRETMANLEGELDRRKFVRVHRSAIVNIEAIREIRSLFHGDHSILLRSGAEVPLGRTFREKLESILGKPL